MNISRRHTPGKIIAAVITLTAAQTLLSAACAVPAANPSPAPAPSDSLSSKEKMALKLIESANELSKTAKHLSSTAIELINNSKENNSSKPGESEIQEKPTTERTIAPSPARRSAATSTRRRNSSSVPEIYIPGLTEEDIENAEDIENVGDIDNVETPGDSIPAGFFPFLSPENVADDTPGSYIWVPDSLQDQVRALIEGTMTTYPANGTYTLAGQNTNNATPGVVRKRLAQMPESQKVLFRGDTLDMVLHDRNLGRFDRSLFNYLAVPKGIWKFALTASYGELSTDDMEIADLLNGISLSGRIFSIKPAISYFIRNNLSLGLRLTYTNGSASVDGFNVDVDEDINFSLKDIDYNSESYRVGFTVTRYLALAPRSRFHLTNELELAFASGSSDFKRPYGGVVKHTHTTSMSVGATYSPGVSVQMMKNVCFDLSFGVFGFNLKSERQTVDGEKMGTRTTSGANFRFNIFNINFGIGVKI